jgi:MSHA pilin protein MshC
MRTGHHRHRGFTIVELVLVIIIVGAIAAISVPRFFEVAGFEDLGEYDEALNAVRYAQQYAVASGCTVRVSIGGNQLALTADCGTGSGFEPLTHPGQCRDAVPAGSANYSCRINGISSSASPFDFDALGSTGVAGSNITITAGGSSFTVNGGSGFIEG